ncbi:hypothetical protein [Rufibacter sp. LB8]|uniref:hypothetical protein n=1 Tax=Rufibacter sp. LB8 TaxID=2777781 RepID=UPI00178C4EF4|nr:hypothetical protein [Rufibacter sp. LB8]
MASGIKTKRSSRRKREKHGDYDFNVFINCPFDDEFKPLFHAIVFTLHDCGFIARCALEGSSQNIRFSRILDIIGECRYGIHDLSRISLEANVMPRNNMPLELGVFIGCREFGTAYDYEKEYLVLDSVPHRYKEHITDLGGEDPSIHFNSPKEAIKCVRDWILHRAPPVERKLIPSPSILFERLTLFFAQAPLLCSERGLVFEELQFSEYVELVTEWIISAREKMENFDRLAAMATK